MAKNVDLQSISHVPLTILSEDERLFLESCRSFAEQRIKPLVRKMDEEAKLERSIIPELFELGLMGIHVPGEYGGGEGSSVHSSVSAPSHGRCGAFSPEVIALTTI